VIATFFIQFYAWQNIILNIFFNFHLNMLYILSFVKICRNMQKKIPLLLEFVKITDKNHKNVKRKNMQLHKNQRSSYML